MAKNIYLSRDILSPTSSFRRSLVDSGPQISDAAPGFIAEEANKGGPGSRDPCEERNAPATQGLGNFKGKGRANLLIKDSGHHQFDIIISEGAYAGKEFDERRGSELSAVERPNAGLLSKHIG